MRAASVGQGSGGGKPRVAAGLAAVVVLVVAATSLVYFSQSGPPDAPPWDADLCPSDPALVTGSTVFLLDLSKPFDEEHLALPGELLHEVRVPAVAAGNGASFQEVSRRYGDFALAGAAALVNLDRDGAVAGARLTLTGSVPIRAHDAEAAVRGEKPSEALFREAARRAVADIEQDSDMHASAEYRRRACEVLARRALAEAAQRAAAAIEAGSP